MRCTGVRDMRAKIRRPKALCRAKGVDGPILTTTLFSPSSKLHTLKRLFMTLILTWITKPQCTGRERMKINA
jgi:hypothetical protein